MRTSKLVAAATLAAVLVVARPATADNTVAMCYATSDHVECTAGDDPNKARKYCADQCNFWSSSKRACTERVSCTTHGWFVVSSDSKAGVLSSRCGVGHDGLEEARAWTKSRCGSANCQTHQWWIGPPHQRDSSKTEQRREEQEREQARVEQERQQREEREREQARVEQARVEQERQARAEQQRRLAEEQRVRDEERDQRAEQQRRDAEQRAQGTHATSASGPTRTVTTQAVQRPPQGSTQTGTMTAVTVGALAGGAALMTLGAGANVEDAVTPFEINVAAQAGMARGGMRVGAGLELRLLRWGETAPRPGETLIQTLRRIRGHELYAVGQVGMLFDSNCTVTPCETSAGKVLGGELGYRYWRGWMGIGAFVAGISEAVTVEDMPSGPLDREEGRPGAAVGAELLAALHRGSKKLSLHGGLRVYLSGIGATMRFGINRMLIGLDFSVNDTGLLLTVGMGMRFAL